MIKKLNIKYSLIQSFISLIFILTYILLFFIHDTLSTNEIISYIFITLLLKILLIIKCNFNFQKELKKQFNDLEKSFQESSHVIYNEHIFSITHELRSPLAVIEASLYNDIINMKKIYTALTPSQQKELENRFIEYKFNNRNISNQYEIIQSFISSLAEHGTYISKKDIKIVNLRSYLQNILLNGYSFSRNMKVFKNNNINFDDKGVDFDNIDCLVKPHDLSRMLINIMTNSADAIFDSYKNKKLLDEKYEPYLKIKCIKSKNNKNNICLNSEFLRVNGEFNECQPFYLIIEDNGPGISKENIEKIFQYGFSTKKDEESDGHRGLGLHVVLKLAELNDIKVYIRTNENGTMFVLGLPNVIYKNDGIIITDKSKELYKSFIINEQFNSNHKKTESDYHKIITEEKMSSQKLNIKN